MAEYRGKKRGRNRARQDQRTTDALAGAEAEEGGRLNKYIARAGVCSRRNADGLIDQGLVKING